MKLTPKYSTYIHFQAQESKRKLFIKNSACLDDDISRMHLRKGDRVFFKYFDTADLEVRDRQTQNRNKDRTKLTWGIVMASTVAGKDIGGGLGM